jgi:hypothetical protein
MFPFIESPNRYTGRKGGGVRLIVIHDMEAPEGPETAENVAHYFQKKSSKASAHFCVDQNSIVQCVKLGDVAWHAPGANLDGAGIEHAGYARQTLEEWTRTEADQTLLNWSALVSAEIVALSRFAKHPINMKFLSDTEVKMGHTGFVKHSDISRIYKKSTHHDPGPGFPEDIYLGKVSWWLGQQLRVDFK